MPVGNTTGISMSAQTIPEAAVEEIKKCMHKRLFFPSFLQGRRSGLFLFLTAESGICYVTAGFHPVHSPPFQCSVKSFSGDNNNGGIRKMR